MRSLLVSLILSAFALTTTAQPYDLKLNLKKGQRYTQSMVMDLNMTQSISGQDINVITKMQFDFSQTVTSITKEGNFALESEYSHIIMNVDAMGQKMAYDSNVKDTAGNELLRTYTGLFDQVLGKKFVVTISPKGKVIGIKGLKELTASFKKLKLDAAGQKLMEGTFDEKKMASNFESTYRIFPDRPVNIGDTWTGESTVESIFPMDINTQYTLKEVNNGVARIIAKGDFKMNKDDYEVNGVKMKVNFTGTYDGSYEMDMNTGISKTGTVAMPMKGSMELMGMEFPVIVKSTLNTSTTPVN